MKGATSLIINLDPDPDIFQSTLPVKGATVIDNKYVYQVNAFQSTLPVKGATFNSAHCINDLNISIHAPCEGSDKSMDIQVMILN